jgi:site-specific DNA recombinase
VWHSCVSAGEGRCEWKGRANGRPDVSNHESDEGACLWCSDGPGAVHRQAADQENERNGGVGRDADPQKQRGETLRREQTRLGNTIVRLITAYQEGLVSLAQLRQRMPELNKKSQAVESELQSLETAAVDHARYLQLAESLDGFRMRLRERAKTLDVCQRQQILRLLVKEVLVAADSITIRDSIPIPLNGPVSHGSPPTGSHTPGGSQKPSYLLRSRSNRTALRCSFLGRTHQPVLHYSGSQECTNQSQQPLIADPFGDLR